MPSRHTFTIRPILELIEKHHEPWKIWVEPYGGFHPICGLSNDINPTAPTAFHMDALDFVKQFESFDGCIFDPPYSPRQMNEAYRLIGRKASMEDTQHPARLAEVKDAVAERMVQGAKVISCGWNSNGFGKSRGFQLEEILLVAHGAAHNDTIVTVEVKR